MEKTSYAIRKSLNIPYAEAVEKVTQALKAEGFGVLTEIDVQQTLKKKIDKDFRKYVILGACNPNLAYQALQTEREIGVLLPCNVVVYENDEGNATVCAMDPEPAMSLVGNPELGKIASEVRGRLEKVLRGL
jgi:uncharacterized protein (DUF302 family)